NGKYLTHPVIHAGCGSHSFTTCRGESPFARTIASYSSLFLTTIMFASSAPVGLLHVVSGRVILPISTSLLFRLRRTTTWLSWVPTTAPQSPFAAERSLERIMTYAP